jgi:valyl-tRNA synthetase
MQKYNRKDIESKWKKEWAESGIYKFKHDKNKENYVVDTPPPYVNADHLHAGHIMSYSQAEFVVRYKRMKGFNVFYPMGFDDNGYPTERFVEKKYKIDKNKTTKKEFIELCLKETEKGAQTYKNLWTNLGISIDWDLTYSTISPIAVKVSQKSLLDLYKKGYLYRKESPILWSVDSQTALAQTDLEDKIMKSHLNYIDFETKNGELLPIATSRPEMLAACVALYCNPKDSRFKQLIGQKAIVPIFNYEVEIKPSEEVDPEFGTGLMMVCTWGDQEDVKKWIKDNLETREILNPDGTLNDLAGKYAGKSIDEARKLIIEDLKENGSLTKQVEIEHSVKVDDRTDTPINFIKNKQWYIKVVDYKDKWIETGQKVNWYPQERFNDYRMWVENISWDWCISRQRYYGVPFPIWYCSECEEPHFVEENLLPHDPSTDACPFNKCIKCGSTNFKPETDVMDTWATSSCTPFLIKELINDETAKKDLFPVSLRPNAFEIIRTWDFFSIVKSALHFDIPPFKDVMISGHGLDNLGRKISKRLGNYIPSDELIDKYGADAIRYWATGAKLGSNLRFNEDELKKGEKLTLKLWNVLIPKILELQI